MAIVKGTKKYVICSLREGFGIGYCRESGRCRGVLDKVARRASSPNVTPQLIFVYIDRIWFHPWKMGLLTPSTARRYLSIAGQNMCKYVLEKTIADLTISFAIGEERGERREQSKSCHLASDPMQHPIST